MDITTMTCVCGRRLRTPSGFTLHQKACPDYKAVIATRFEESKQHNAKKREQHDLFQVVIGPFDRDQAEICAALLRSAETGGVKVNVEQAS